MSQHTIHNLNSLNRLCYLITRLHTEIWKISTGLLDLTSGSGRHTAQRALCLQDSRLAREQQPHVMKSNRSRNTIYICLYNTYAAFVKTRPGVPLQFMLISWLLYNTLPQHKTLLHEVQPCWKSSFLRSNPNLITDKNSLNMPFRTCI